MTEPRRLILNVNFTNPGNHAGAWLSPEVAPWSFSTVDHYVDVARIAERGGLDAIFLSDIPSVSEQSLRFRPTLMFEPGIALATIAAKTEHIGLIATVSATFNEPFNVARTFGTLDHASAGRVAVNIVTNTGDRVAQNYGQKTIPDHALRYQRADEFITVLKALWSSWGEGAIIADRDNAAFYDPSRIRAIDHVGEHFSVRGPLTLPRSPQGRPVIFQAGGSGDGRDLAARHADAVFCIAHTPESALELRADIHRRASAMGQAREAIRFLPGIMLIVGSTDEEARRRQRELDELVPLSIGLEWLEGNLGIDIRGLDPDAPLPVDILPPVKASHSIAAELVKTARRDKLTIRQLIQLQGSGGTIHLKLAGGPETISDHMQHWFLSGAADGFNMNFDVLPTGVQAFADYVMPELRKRGLVPQEPDRRHLRQRLQLAAIA
ncbi:MAG: NtaA/DmoA family FMN-dependent monooxygenase [Rhizobium sp.]